VGGLLDEIPLFLTQLEFTLDFFFHRVSGEI
jgi:hypothetical protein